MGGETRQRKSVHMQGAKQLAEANLPIHAVADIAPADFAAAIAPQQRGIDFCVHSLFLVWVAY